MRLQKRWMGWWYLCIALGFTLLGLRNLLAGAPAWTVALRWMIAAGFLLLGAGTLRSGGVLLLICLAPLSGVSRAQTAPDAVDIVRKSVQRDLVNYERLKNYTYTQRNVQRIYDNQGRLKKTETETYEILILSGRDYEKLIARDDRPLPEKEARKEQDKMDKEIARREHESGADKSKFEKQRAEQREFLKELPDAFQFRLVGEENISGQPAWAITAEPNPNYRAKQRLAKVLTKMRGKIWIDKGEYQWVKVEANAISPLSFGLGLLRIEPGAILRFEQARINEEVWLPAAASIHVDARVALFKQVHTDVDMRFRDYRKFQAESQFIAGEPVR